MTTYLYVEGGGDGKNLMSECAKGFRIFLEKAGLSGNMPRIVACGPRTKAFDKFRVACQMKDPCFLLVDSEELVADDDRLRPWRHLRNRIGDGWERPANAADEQCHLMVVCMEAWFLADRDALAEFFGQGFNDKSLPRGASIENIPKSDVFRGLQEASKNCKTKAPYGKGAHSFKILALIAPEKVVEACEWAGRFLDALRAIQSAE